jgi:DNA gyrase/topoisomerase IV subunit B
MDGVAEGADPVAVAAADAAAPPGAAGAAAGPAAQATLKQPSRQIKTVTTVFFIPIPDILTLLLQNERQRVTDLLQQMARLTKKVRVCFKEE